MISPHVGVADDEVGMLKHEMFCLAMQRMMDCRTWGNTLTGNCLPACLCILPEIQAAYPSARVVIGDIGKIGQAQPDCRLTHQFIKGQVDRTPSFHAWIDLGNGDLFDPVGPSWLNQGGTYLDASQAQEQGICYYPCLTQVGDVNIFYQNLLGSRTSA